jgi:hypothetical protein
MQPKLFGNLAPKRRETPTAEAVRVLEAKPPARDERGRRRGGTRAVDRDDLVLEDNRESADQRNDS